MGVEEFEFHEENGAEEQTGNDAGIEAGSDDPLIGTGHVTELTGKYKDWFLDYASYVILERAVPHTDDGLKPVQRRILHAMRQIEDGRYNKVANIIGQTMQYHPHGDASIGDALVQLGQKKLLIDTQGNWGNIFTGDGAAASRYIEARLSKFALEVVFNPRTTAWKLSYDGRNKEPVTLPVKFPLLLAQGVEGIAVGLASKILPHNFNELIDASIAHLQGKSYELYPDFPTGGLVDVSRYNDGLRGGAVKIRAKISKLDKKSLVISELPFGQTTTSLIDSVLKANEKGKIRIRKIDDNTAGTVEIVIHLLPGADPDVTIDALYAFTDCEVPASPNACVIRDEKPCFIGVSEILRESVENTVQLLTLELQIRLDELGEIWHYASLERIFIENELYEPIKLCKTEESILETIETGLVPFRKKLRRDVIREDLVRLSNIPIKRISKFSIYKAEEFIRQTEAEMEEVKNHLANIIPYSISYYRQIKKKFGTGRERKTEIRGFDTITATEVALANAKLYVNRAEGFIGTGLKKDEYVCDCSDIDDIIVIRKDGKFLIAKVSEKQFVGKDIEFAGVFKKNDERTIYNVIYRDGENGTTYIKRCAITGLMRGKEYTLTKGESGSRILYLSVNPNGEAETVKVTLKPRPRVKKLVFDAEFSETDIKGRSSIGNIITRYPVHKIELKEKGVSTLGGRKIWWDETVQRLNIDGKGSYLGEFSGNDRILVLTREGEMRLSGYELTTHFEEDWLVIRKYRPGLIFTVVYYDGEQKLHYIKRFEAEAMEKPSRYFDEHPRSKFILLSVNDFPRLELKFGGKHKKKDPVILEAADFIAVKGYKAKGKRLSNYEVAVVNELEPLRFKVELPEPPVEELPDEPVPGDNEPKIPEGGDTGEQMSLF
ncbi:MAG: DNA gyrase/topoisomerase IV subunit A [Bacteroidales bacterium]|nr:DNA gyrase/topoisomerase IV subunit A [Bacteroidales bacterium]